MALMRRRSAVGEMSALRAELAASGLSAEDIAAEYDEWKATVTAALRARAAARQSSQ
jgi:hypothetical protein